MANWRLLRARAAPAECAAVVKADAYGLGAAKVAPALWRAGCRTFFTANPEGALALRRHLPQAAICVLNGLLGEARAYVRAGLVPVLNDLGQVERWAAAARRLGRRLAAVLQVDTGMNRLGLPPAELERLAGRPELLAAMDLRFAMSHLACADQPRHPMNEAQLRRFRAICRRFPGTAASLANSSGIFLGRGYRLDLVRPGYALYGGNPTPGQPNPMAPAVRLSARILQLREVAAGEAVGYGASHEVAAATRIATVPVGYADGYLRCLGGRARAFLDGIEVPVVGRVSMDLATLDIGAAGGEKARVGAWVDLIGGAGMLDELAAAAGTIGYELLTALGRRYRRVYLGGGAA